MTRFNEFIRERQYLHNVSLATVSWYTHALKWLPSETPTQDDLKGAVLRMREKGLKETGCNAAIRAINAYLHWSSGSERKCGPGCTHPRMPMLKEPQTIMPALTEAQIKLLVNWKPKPKDFYERRLHLLVLFLLDTGARISEVLGLRVGDLNLDDTLVTLNGKGRKQRTIPFSVTMRKALYRYIADFGLQDDSLLLTTRAGGRVGRLAALRSVKLLCERLGFTPPGRTLHAFRHSFAAGYVRRGGSVFHLQQMLGHTTLEMSKRYASLTAADLQAVHERASLLTPGT